MKVKLTTHAAERFWERFNIDVDDNKVIPFPKGVTVSRHQHEKTGNTIVEQVFQLKGKLAMAVVDVDNATMVTVYSEGPYFDKRVRQATAMLRKAA